MGRQRARRGQGEVKKSKGMRSRIKRGIAGDMEWKMVAKGGLRQLGLTQEECLALSHPQQLILFWAKTPPGPKQT